jgi:hypothetical protein
MTKNVSKVLLAAVMAAVVLTSCSKVPEQSKYIPKNAGFVLSLNSKQLTNKLVTNGFTLDKMFTAIQSKDSASAMAKAWKDAENSGVDLQNNFFVTFVPGPNGQSYVSLVGSLKDAGKFEDFLKKNVASFTLKKKNDFQYIWSERQKTVIGWNKETVIALKGIDPYNMEQKGLGLPSPDDADSTQAVDSAIASPAAAVTVQEEDAWATIEDHLFHLKSDETASNIPAFKDLLKSNDDVSMFLSGEAIYSAQTQSNPMMAMMDMRKLVEGSYYTGSLNFEKGSVEMKGSSYVGKTMADIYKKYGKMEADMSMLEKYPSNNIDGFVVYGIDLRAVGDILKLMNMDGMANMALRSSNLTMDDILAAFKGQLVYVASDFAVRKAPVAWDPTDSTTKPSAKWVYAMKMGDKAAFDKVMTSPLLASTLTKKGDQYVLAQQIPDAPAMSINDKLIVLASDQALLDQYIAGSGKAEGLDNSFVSKIKGNPFGGYVDVQKLSGAVPSELAPADAHSIIDEAKSLVKDITMVAHSFDGTKADAEITVHFINKDENSLVQLVKFGTDAANYFQQHKAAEAKADAAAMPVDTAVAY